MSEYTLETKINDNPDLGLNTKLVKTALRIIERSKTIQQNKLKDIDNIQDLLDDTFDIQEQSNEKLPAFILQQTIFNFISRMKPIDVMMKSDGIDEEARRLVSEGVAAVLKESGFVNMLRDNFGGFYQMLAYGDFFSMVGADEKGLPEFKSADIAGIYFDPTATNIRNNSSGRSLTRCTIVFEYDWDEAIVMFPEIEKKATAGDLPSTDDYEQNQAIDPEEENQRNVENDRKIQIGYYYDIGKEPYFGIIAGPTAAVIDEVKGEEYPFYFGEGETRENYIPILQWMTFPTKKGIMNAGLGHIVYRIAKIYRQLSNKAINQVMDNVDPIRIMNLPQQQASGFLAKVKAAQEAVKKGKKGVIVNAYAQGDQQSGTGFMDTLSSTQVTGDFERLLAFFDKTLNGFGINLQRVFTDPQKTATAIEFEEESLGDVVSQIQEQNATTYEFAFKLVIDYIKKNIDETDDTPVNVSRVDEVSGEVIPFTLGMLAEALNARQWDVVVNARTGVYPSKTMDKFYLQSAINDMVALGDVEGAMELMNKKHSLNGISMPKRKQPTQGQAVGPIQEEGQMNEAQLIEAGQEELQIA